MKHIHGFLASPPLWKHEQFGLKQFVIPEINLNTFRLQPIPENLRLGHQVEHILYQLLDHSEACDVLAHNIQIKRGHDTLGELDFLIRFRESGHLLHLELTYKFYIIDPSISEPIHQLIGPNRKDAFFAKLEKTKQKQLPLLYTEEGIKTLQSLEIDPLQIEQQVLFLGQLFIPYKATPSVIDPLNTDCIVGFWIQLSNFKSSVFKGYQYYITQKKEWIHTPHHDVVWTSYQEALSEIQAKHLQKRAPIVWIKKDDKTIDRCFIVWW
ncbi:DUF1853 family protein [Dokdonia sp.]|uniref:DUF1853 family protein n=1 Tax=Dokdonia sp. TaxID=2024995 RepID=UPI003264B9EC